MPTFSGSRGYNNTKIYYEGYIPAQPKTMARALALSRTHSLSSYQYGEGVTDGGKACKGHRAGRSVTAAGDTVFFDFDDSGLTFEQLQERLDGCAAFIGPSKSWSEAVLKFHVGVQIDRPLPLSADEFTLWYRAIGQWLGFAGYYDPCMEVWVQQIAPSLREDGPDWSCEGSPLCMDDVLAAYMPDEVEVGSRGGVGVAGVVDEDAVFVRSDSLDELDVEAMRDAVLAEGKVRVHCLKKLEHDGRRDTAFVSAMDGSVYYHCSGGRCGQTLILAQPPGFEEELVEGEEAIDPMVQPDGLDEWIAQARVMIENHPIYCFAYDPEASEMDRENAAGWVGTAILDRVGVRIVEGAHRHFDGRMWVKVFEDKADRLRFATKVCRAAGFYSLAHNPNKLPRLTSYLMDQVRVLDVQNTHDALNLQNGVYVVDVGLCKHDPRYMFTSVLPYSYDAEASCPVWERTVEKIMMGSWELVRALQDALGYLLLPRYNLEKLVCFVGEGANGKTTVNKVIKALVGPANYSNQRLHLLTKSAGEGAYARAMLSGKLINVTEELSPKALEAEMFKEIISGDGLDARWPYGRPFTLARVPKQLASTNTTDRLIQERTHGYARRLHLIPFNYTVTDAERDDTLSDKLLAELPGILNWVMMGAVRVMRNQGLTQAAEMDALTAQVHRDANSAQQFLEERVDALPYPRDNQKLPAAVTHVATLYESYVEFCNGSGYSPLGRNKFSAEAERLGYQKVNKTVTIRGNVVKVYGFLTRLLHRNEWREPGEVQRDNPLKLV